jgi:hypothetical protein
LERALAIHEAAGADHWLVGEDLRAFALVLLEEGELTAARQALERALAIYEAVHGADHRFSKAVRELLRDSGMESGKRSPTTAEYE